MATEYPKHGDRSPLINLTGEYGKVNPLQLHSEEFQEHFHTYVCLAQNRSKGAWSQFRVHRYDHDSALIIPEFDMATTLTDFKKSGAAERTQCLGSRYHRQRQTHGRNSMSTEAMIGDGRGRGAFLSSK
jgi:hypothetical protein